MQGIAVAQNTLPSPPFNQCPAVGANSGCAILIVIDSNGGLRIVTDASQGPYDGVEDTLIGVVNNSSNTVLSIPVRGSAPIFGFDGDGICAIDSQGNPIFQPAPAGCPFGISGYEGPGVSFTNVSSDLTSGSVNFNGGIPRGGTAYFSLEGAIQTRCAPLNVSLLTQYDAAWATDTYDHVYKTRNFRTANTTALNASGNVELVVFPAGTGQSASGTSYPIALTAATNNLNGLRNAINALGVSGLSAAVSASTNGSAVLTLTGSATIGAAQLRSTAGNATTNLLTSIKAKGCYLTSSAMVINYHAALRGSPFRTSPRDLNDYLNSTPLGYINSGDINPTEVALYARRNGVPLSYAGRLDRRDDFTLDQYVCSGQPVLLKVGTPHFVVATGQKTVSSLETYSINDPGHNNADLRGYGNDYSGMRLFKAGNSTLSALYVYAHSPVELVLTDAAGRHTGTDPRTGKSTTDIPSSGYGVDTLADDEDASTSDPTPEVKALEVLDPTTGKFQLEAIGTGTGPFTLDFIAYDNAGNSSFATFQGTASLGSIASYAVTYSSAIGSVIQVQPAADTTPPTIAGMPTNICNIWPPNRRMVTVATIGATDNGTGVASLNVNVVSSEPGSPREIQYVVTTDAKGNKVVSLLADRNGRGPGRTYTVTAVAKDRAANQSQARATCTVPHDQRHR